MPEIKTSYTGNVHRKYGALSSSNDPQKFSLALKGLVPFLLVLAAFFNLDISENDIVQGTEWILMIWTGAVGIYGLIRRIANWMRSRENP